MYGSLRILLQVKKEFEKKKRKTRTKLILIYSVKYMII
jgi:hypothetical protein